MAQSQQTPTATPVPLPNVPISSANGVTSRPWWRFLNLISGKALGGTVTQIIAGAGLSGGVITVNGTIELVGPGSETLTANGQLLIGDSVTGIADANTLTPGANITITNGPGTIEIAANAQPGGIGLTVNGELWIGDTVAGQGVVGFLTQGVGVLITNGAGTITLAARLVAGRGISITGAGALTIAELVPAIEQTTSANPIGTTSTTAVMMGLAGTITPAFSTRVLVTISGSCANSVLADGGTVQISYGTGTAPVNGAALTGTQIGSAQEWLAATAANIVPFSVSAVIFWADGRNAVLD